VFSSVESSIKNLTKHKKKGFFIKESGVYLESDTENSILFSIDFNKEKLKKEEYEVVSSYYWSGMNDYNHGYKGNYKNRYEDKSISGNLNDYVRKVNKESFITESRDTLKDDLSQYGNFDLDVIEKDLDEYWGIGMTCSDKVNFVFGDIGYEYLEQELKQEGFTISPTTRTLSLSYSKAVEFLSLMTLGGGYKDDLLRQI